MFFNKRLGFFSSNLDRYIEQIKEGDYTYLSMVFCVFAEESSKHKIRAAKILKEVLNDNSLDELYIIDRQMRQTTSMEWSINWRELSTNHFTVDEMSMEEKRAVLIFASFHPNGYIREEAVKSLVAYKDTLPFILLRCNDWVSQVHQAALVSLSKSLEKASDEEVVNILPLMEKLRRSGRCEFNNILSIIVSTMKSNKSLIKKGLRSRDVRARQFSIFIVKDLLDIHASFLSEHLQCEKDPFLRKMIFKILIERNLNTIDLAKQFLKDKHPQNRLLALEFLCNKDQDLVIDAAEKLLLDRDSKVREMARSIVSQGKRHFDIHQYYLDNLPFNTRICIYGLGEIGTLDDCRLLEKYLIHDSNGIVCAAMTALMRLDAENYASQITEMLSSEHSSIVKRAAFLLKKYEIYEFEKIFEIQECSYNEDTKIKCASLLFRSSKWKALIYILMLIGSKDEQLENLCQAQLDTWIISYNRSYEVLTESDKVRIEELMMEKKKFITDEKIKNIYFLCK